MNANFEFLIRVQVDFLHGGKFFDFGYSVTRIGNQFSHKDIMVGIQPFLDNRENIFTMNGQIAFLGFHYIVHSFNNFYKNMI
jgi:hypothetical protein